MNKVIPHEPIYFIGESLTKTDFNDWKDVLAIFWSVPNNQFEYIFEYNDGVPWDFIPEYRLESVFDQSQEWIDECFDGDLEIYKEGNYDRHYEILYEYPFDLIPEFHEIDISHLLVYECCNFEWGIKYLIELKFDFPSLDSSNHTQKVSYNNIGFWMSFGIATTLPLYKIGLELKVWNEEEKLINNSSWLELVEYGAFDYINRGMTSQSVLTDAFFSLVLDELQPFRAILKQEKNYNKSSVLLTEKIMLYLNLSKQIDLFEEISTKFLDFMESLEEKIHYHISYNKQKK